MNTTTRRDSPAKRSGKLSGITPSQRAAVIIALLGEEAAKPIVDKLDDAALAKVVTALEHISVLAREELVEIVIDFLTQLRQSSGSMRGGRERARQVMSGIVGPSRLNAVYGGETDSPSFEPADEGDIWSRLREREPKQVAEYLGRLPPNIIALILRKLDAGATSTILCLLPDEKVSPTLGFMVASANPDPGIDSAIERMIAIEFLNNAEVLATEGDEHLETIGEVLSLIPDEKRDSLVNFLRSNHENKLVAIQKGIFTIESLPDILPRNAVPVVFREIDNAQVVGLLASMRENYQAASDFLLSNISSRMADALREEIKAVPPMPKEVSDAFQRDFLTALMDLRRRGLITILKLNRSE